jgi:Holliday junction resolvase
MGRINSKKKGSKNERALAKIFSKWTKLEFSRTPSSGGLRWHRTDDTVGDIVCISKDNKETFPFSIETKFHRDINFQELLLGNKGCKILEFWNQALEDSKRGGKIPLVLMRYNNMPKGVYFVLIPVDIFKILKLIIPNEYGRINYNKVFYIINSEDLFKSDYKQVYLKIIGNGKK